jgi:hypothetical protein
VSRIFRLFCSGHLCAPIFFLLCPSEAWGLSCNTGFETVCAFNISRAWEAFPLKKIFRLLSLGKFKLIHLLYSPVCIIFMRHIFVRLVCFCDVSGCIKRNNDPLLIWCLSSGGMSHVLNFNTSLFHHLRMVAFAGLISHQICSFDHWGEKYTYFVYLI